MLFSWKCRLVLGNEPKIGFFFGVVGDAQHPSLEKMSIFSFYFFWGGGWLLWEAHP